MGKHAEWRKVAKKLRRKRIRQTVAIYKHKQSEEERILREKSPTYIQHLKTLEEAEAFQEQEELRQHQEAEENWLKIEAEARKQWLELQKKITEAQEERLRQSIIIKMEWEREQKRLKAIKEMKEKEREEDERRQNELKEELDQFILHGGSTPEHLKIPIELNPNRPLCSFFRKTAACRFRDACSRNHVKPRASRTLLIPNFYVHYSLEQGENEHGDSSLEFENDETYAHFKEFFFDVLPEMERFGRVRQFKVCSNHEAHLRGNVYVEYSTTREAIKSFQRFNGRWYGGKQLNVEFCHIDSWKTAICGLHARKRCPKGSSCNFMHVFRNPHNLFHKADDDQHRTPPRRERHLEEERNWRWSESPEKISFDHTKSHYKERRHRNRDDSSDRSHSKRRSSKRR